MVFSSVMVDISGIYPTYFLHYEQDNSKKIFLLGKSSECQVLVALPLLLGDIGYWTNTEFSISHIFKTQFIHCLSLAGRKRKKCSRSTYILSTDPTDLSRQGNSTLATVRWSIYVIKSLLCKYRFSLQKVIVKKDKVDHNFLYVHL